MLKYICKRKEGNSMFIVVISMIIIFFLGFKFIDEIYNVAMPSKNKKVTNLKNLTKKVIGRRNFDVHN